VNGARAPAVITAGWTFCDEDESRAREMAIRWIGGYWRTAMRHYEIGGEHWKHTKGYEFYASMSAASASGAGQQQVTEAMLDLQIWGTPKQCVERILNVRERVGAGSFVGVFSYAGMPYDEAERNLRLFAEKALPELREA
jgi:alkanesulfonate monooxygenase SsuD/methylene tetrahydromethanopterin reductase-like flavin-dependent oxidoreductase (luciferase family)